MSIETNELAEKIVDAVGGAFGIDTGTCSEVAFCAALEAVENLLNGRG
jgi:hypothetical protein